MGSLIKEVEKDIIAYIPSKDLQDEYYKDIREGNGLNFTDRELFNMVIKLIPDIENLTKLRFLYKLYRSTNDRFLVVDIKKAMQKIDKKNLIKDKNIKDFDINNNTVLINHTHIDDADITFVNYKTLFKYGDIIKCKYNNEYRYGIVCNYNYEKIKYKYICYDDNVYICFLLDDVDDTSIKRFIAHKDSTERCTYEELPYTQKDALFKIITKAKSYNISKEKLIKQINIDEFLHWCLESLTSKYTKHISTFSNGYIHELTDKLWCLCGGARKSFLYDIVYDYLNKNFKLYGIYPKEDWRNDWIRH